MKFIRYYLLAALLIPCLALPVHAFFRTTVRVRGPFISSVNVGVPGVGGYGSFAFNRGFYGGGYSGLGYGGYGFSGYGGYGLSYPSYYGLGYSSFYSPPTVGYVAPSYAQLAPSPCASVTYVPPVQLPAPVEAPPVMAPVPVPVYQQCGYSYVPALGVVAPIYSYGSSLFFRSGAGYSPFVGSVFSTYGTAVTHFGSRFIPGVGANVAVNVAAAGRVRQRTVVRAAPVRTKTAVRVRTTGR